jgi:polyisoprenoid-binding protein YceI
MKMVRIGIRTLQALLLIAAAVIIVGDAKGQSRPVLEWVADRAHSSIEFRTSHWGIVDIIGWFAEFEVVVYSDSDDFADAVIEAWVAPASVQMPNSGMATNLRRMFAVQEYPDARFRSTDVRFLSDNEYEVTGQLTMRGVTREIKLLATFNGRGFMPNGLPGFTLHTDLNRLEFGIGEEEVLEENQNPTIGYIVKVTCNIRLEHPE